MSTLAQAPQLVNGQAYTLPPQKTDRLPEAACSMTARLLVPAISREAILVTGRGHTGAEAARNLRDSCAALRDPPASAPLPSRTQRLSLLLACGLEKATAQGNTARIERLIKATALVLGGCVEHASDALSTVCSQTEPTKTAYQVGVDGCTCQDAQRHAEESAWYCKHRLAVLMVTKLDAQEQDG